MDLNYGDIIVIFFIVYVIVNLFVGCFIDWMGIKKGYFWVIFVWFLGVCFYVLCGWVIEEILGIYNVEEMFFVIGVVVLIIVIISVYYFIVV